jgi:hypothetical protein
MLIALTSLAVPFAIHLTPLVSYPLASFCSHAHNSHAHMRPLSAHMLTTHMLTCGWRLSGAHMPIPTEAAYDKDTSSSVHMVHHAAPHAQPHAAAKSPRQRSLHHVQHHGHGTASGDD